MGPMSSSGPTSSQVTAIEMVFEPLVPRLLRNRHGRLVASGVYFWHVVTPSGEERVGKFTIVNPHRDPFGSARP